MRINEITRLDQFVVFCEDVISIDKEDNGEEDWFAFIIARQASESQLLDDYKNTLGIYYYWLKIAQNEEFYHLCKIIYEAIEIENKHYKALLKSIFKKSFKKEIIQINEDLKEKL